MIEDLPKETRPREKAYQYGISSLSDVELLAIVLRNGYKGTSSLELADKILKEVGGLAGLMKMDMKEIMEIKGVKLAKAVEIMASLEMVKRICYREVEAADVITRPDAIRNWLQKSIGNRDQEVFVVLYLDAANRVKGYEELFSGSSDHVQIELRELFNAALRNHANKIIIAHNHPTQRVSPSPADIRITEEIAKAGKILNIPLLDHVIVGFNDSFSFLENQLI